MSIAAASSPLSSLVWVFAVSSICIGAISVGALGLAFRHQVRRKKGIYEGILAESESSRVLQVLTIRDAIISGAIRRQFERTLAERGRSTDGNAALPDQALPADGASPSRHEEGPDTLSTS
jgi:hypothetical protein